MVGRQRKLHTEIMSFPDHRLDVDPSYGNNSPTCAATFCRFGCKSIASTIPSHVFHHAVADNAVGIVSSSMFAGMMFGAVGWGTCASHHQH